MKHLLAGALMSLLKVVLAPKRRSFENALRNPRKAQARLFREILHLSSTTVYGRSLALDGDATLAEFRERVPIATYDALSPWIERERAGGIGTIAPEKALFFETTSGSSGARKWIPYTRRLKSSFHRMFLLWLGDLLLNGPKIGFGSVWMSVSPVASGVTGLTDDAEYVDGFWAPLLRRYFAVPSAIRLLSEEASFRHALAVFLVACDDLEVISIWNPSLLRAVMTHVERNLGAVLEDALSGQMELEGLTFKFKRLEKRRLGLFARGSIAWGEVWPDLRLISCWGGAHAASLIAPLRAAFPGVVIQEKGLLATEAPLTVPWIRASGFVPLVDEVFYELEDAKGGLHLLDDVVTGETYQVIFSQKGGLLRYRIGDLVKVTGRYLGSPTLEFVGRADAVCDTVGEKLHESFVARCIERAELGGAAFRCLFPFYDSAGWRYVLLGESLPTAAAERTDEILKTGFHYGLARRQGQLLPLISFERADAERVVQAACMGSGMRLGDIKPSVLIRDPEIGRRIMEMMGAGQPFRPAEAQISEVNA